MQTTHGSLWWVVLFCASFSVKSEEGGGEEGGGVDIHEEDNLVLGLSMLGGLLLTMGLWYLGHSKDVDIRLTTWNIISDTISIFAAVLIYQFTSEFVEQIVMGISLESESCADFEKKRMFNQFEVVLAYGLMNCMMAWAAGLFSGHDERKKIMENERRFFDRQTYIKVCLLFAHVTGFVGMAGWGMVQTTKCGDRTYYETAFSSAGLIPQAFIKWFFILFSLGIARDQFIRRVIKPAEEDELVDVFQETIIDAENDVYGLYVSFLIVQSIRFAVAGNLPDMKGDEGKHGLWNHTFGQCVGLFICSGFLLLSGFLVNYIGLLMDKCFGNKEGEGEEEKHEEEDESKLSYFKQNVTETFMRLKDIGINISTMCFAWCFMHASRTAIATTGFQEDKMGVVQVLTATFVSVASFGFVFILDMLADMDDRMKIATRTTERAEKGSKVIHVCHDEERAWKKGDILLLGNLKKKQKPRVASYENGVLTIRKELKDALPANSKITKRMTPLEHCMDGVPRKLMKSAGLMIGFAWESAFDTGVDGIKEQVESPTSQVLLMTAVGLTTCAAVLPVWRWFIVPMVIDKGYILGLTIRQIKERIRQQHVKPAHIHDHKHRARSLLQVLVQESTACKIMDLDGFKLLRRQIEDERN